jgi:hypothetical protein
VVKRSPAGRFFVVHVDKLKPFSGSLSENWLRYMEVNGKNFAVHDAITNGENGNVLQHGMTKVLDKPVEQSCELLDSGKLAGLGGESAPGQLAGPEGTSEGSPSGRRAKQGEKNTPCVRPKRDRRPPAWQRDFVCRIGISSLRSDSSFSDESMEVERKFVCNQRNRDDQVCGRRFSTDSGIRRHCVTVHGRRYHANRTPSPMGEEEQRDRVTTIRRLELVADLSTTFRLEFVASLSRV